MTSSALMYWNDKLQSSQAHVLTFLYESDGAGAYSPLVAGYPTLTSSGAITQADIDAHLLTSSEFTAAQFDATAMGTDAFACIVDMRGRQAQGSSSSQKGQAEKLVAVEAALYTADSLDDSNGVKDTGLTDSTLAPEATLGANGNLAARCVLTGADAAAAGSIIKVQFHVIMK